MSLISREDAIKELMSWLPKLENGLIHWTGVKAMLENLPTVNPDGWISVEDRLPEIDMSYPHSDYYLVWYDGCDIPDIASYSNVNRFWTGHVTGPYWWNAAPFCKVIAWMPLPPAFEPKEDK